MRVTCVSRSKLLLILGVLQVRLVSSFPSFTGKLEVLATFLMLVDLLMLVGEDGELPAISASSAADEFVDFLNVPGGLPFPLPLPKPRLDSEE